MPRSFPRKVRAHLDRLDRSQLENYLDGALVRLDLMGVILDTMNEAVLAVNADDVVTFANSSVLDLLGLPVEEAEKALLDDCLRDSALRDALHDAGIDAYFSIDVNVTFPRQLTLSVQVIPLPSGKAAARTRGGETRPIALILFRDVTHELSERSARERATRIETLRLLTAGVAHEIGNPLSALILHAQLMKRTLDRLPNDDTTRKLSDIAGVIYDEGQRLKRIVGDFLNAVRPLALSRHPVRVSRILDDTLELMYAELESRNVALIRAFQDDPETLVDADQLRSAFINIIRNAVDAMPGGGTLTVGISAHGDAIAVTFTDDGAGIAPENMPRVFTPYYTSKANGSGLGMLITQRIVNAHGGSVALDSEPGTGTTVTIKLPVTRSARRRSLPLPKEETEQ